MKQNYESGRSMVEMLGTLAIIGVLSIGGIVGYSYAMDRYRANETINEINLRLQTLEMQSELDRDLNLNEFEDTTSLGYIVGDNYGRAEDDTRVYVGFSGIQQGVCEIIYDEMVNLVERIDVTADRTVDASTLCGDNNEMKFYVDSGIEVECEPACGEDEYCMSGIKCVKKWEKYKTALTKCIVGDNTPCGECKRCQSNVCVLGENNNPCDNGNGVCLNGVCVSVEENSCSEHSDCPDGYYCAPEPSVCASPKQGYKCAKLDFSYYPITLSDGSLEIWYKSNQYMHWNNAMAACEAMGKKIPSYAEWKKMPYLTDGVLWTSSDSSPTACNMAYASMSHRLSKHYNAAYAICR